MLRAASGFIVIALCLWALPSAADVYRFVDDKGEVHYTDRPETLPAELLARIKSQRTDKSAVSERMTAEDQQQQANQTAQTNSADKQKANKSTAADKADRCAKARERYDQLMSAQQVYSTNEKGERVYMEDKQVEQARASAKQLMDTWCN